MYFSELSKAFDYFVQYYHLFICSLTASMSIEHTLIKALMERCIKVCLLKCQIVLVGFKWVFPFFGGSKNLIFLYVYKYQFFKWKNFRKFHAFFPQTATREIARSSHITLQGGRVVDPFIHVQ